MWLVVAKVHRYTPTFDDAEIINLVLNKTNKCLVISRSIVSYKLYCVVNLNMEALCLFKGANITETLCVIVEYNITLVCMCLYIM